MKDFYPLILATQPPTIVTRKEVDEYYRERGTVVKILHIPALAQGGPGDDSDNKPERFK